MAYQVLARKWRPARFDQVIGQEHVLKALTHALEQNRLHHAYLFSGTRGVGKTSIARLLAKGLNCETGITATPCEQCSHCREISEGRFVDLLEIDAASRTKVDDTREILDNVQYQPVRGRFKVYLIDEVHMLSRHSFNALLKTLEEPPPHVKFLLATTDPQKLPVTVLSRCLQFNLKSVPVSRISAHLAAVLTSEQITFEPSALELLAQAADGSVRDGMSLTDQAIAHGGGQLSLASVQAMLGTLDSSYALRLLQALAQGEPQSLMSVLDEIEQFAPDHDDLLKQMASTLHQMALCQFNVRSAALTEQGQSILALAQQLDREQVQLWYQMLTQGRADLKFAPDPRSGFEMVLLRALAFAPLEPAPAMAAAQPQLMALSTTSTTPLAALPANQTEPKSPQASDTPQKSDTTQEGDVSQKSETQAQSRALEASLHAEQAALLLQAQQQLGGSKPASTSLPETTPEPILPHEPTSLMPADEAAMHAEQEMIWAQAEQQGYGQSEFQSDSPLEPLPAGTISPTAAPTVNQAHTAAPEDPFQALLDQALANHQHLQSRSAGAESAAEQEDPTPEPPKLKVKVETITLSEPGIPVPDQRPSFASSGPFADNSAYLDADPPPWALDGEVDLGVPEPKAAIPVLAHSKPQPSESVPIKPAPEPDRALSPPSEQRITTALGSELAINETDMFWYETLAQLGIGARPRQLAVNSVLERDGQMVRLHLSPEQRHLNHEAVIAPLKTALTQAWGETLEMQIIESHLEGRETPLLVRRRLHQERLVQARAELLNDPAVQWLQSQFDAKLIEESVGY